MLSALTKKELRVAIRSPRLLVVALASFALSGIATAMGTAEHLERRALHEEVMALGQASFEGQKPDHPHAIAHNGYVVSRPPAPLGFLDAGLERVYGRWLRLDA